MFRINLLPKEVLERRRYEGWYRWVIIGAAVLIAIVLAVYALLLLEVSGKNGDLQGVEEQSKQYTSSAAQLSIFQAKEEELNKRMTVAQTALVGRINVGQVANDISLVLPDEVWLDLLSISEKDGVALTGDTPRNSGEANDVAYKSVAKTLVRLNELPQLYDVWLSTATNTEWSAWPPPATGQPAALPLKVVMFQASGKLVVPTSTPASGTAGVSSTGVHTVAPANAAQSAVNAANSSATTKAP